MDQVRALNDSTGAAIADIIEPTYKIFTPLLMKRKGTIFAAPRSEVSYGTHPRQKLDIYLPTQKAATAPILVFFYGGGFIRGDKILPVIPEGLIYRNLGAFFANSGITTIIADYRRVNSESGGENAVFPSGGEDVSLVMKWLEGFSNKGSGNVFIMGNSAGGVHTFTFLLAPQFLEQRKSLVSGEKGITLKGAIGLGVPFHFHSALPARLEMLGKYYGSSKEVTEQQPYGLLEAIEKTVISREETAVPKMLLLLGEFDPEDEIARSMLDFTNLVQKIWGSAAELHTIKGHNHLSPVAALMCGDVDAEKWGGDAAEWMKSSNN